MVEVTPEILFALNAHLSAQFRTRLIDKDDAVEMQMVSQFLDDLGVMDSEVFLDRFTTTIGRTIYLSFDLGEGENLLSQARTLAHENQHARQFVRDGGMKFSFYYLADSAKRAAYEAEAYTTTMEAHWLLTGELLDPVALADNLVYYAVTNADVATVEKRLSLVAKTIEAGGIITEAGKSVKVFLNQYAFLKQYES